MGVHVFYLLKPVSLVSLFVPISDKISSNAQAVGIFTWNKIFSEAYVLCSCGISKLIFREYAIMSTWGLASQSHKQWGLTKQSGLTKHTGTSKWCWYQTEGRYFHINLWALDLHPKASFEISKVFIVCVVLQKPTMDHPPHRASRWRSIWTSIQLCLYDSIP